MFRGQGAATPWPLRPGHSLMKPVRKQLVSGREFRTPFAQVGISRELASSDHRFRTLSPRAARAAWSSLARAANRPALPCLPACHKARRQACRMAKGLPAARSCRHSPRPGVLIPEHPPAKFVQIRQRSAFRRSRIFIFPERPLLAALCKAADDPDGCTVGISANERARGYCYKHAARIRRHGSPYLAIATGRKPAKSWLSRFTDLLRRI